VLELRGPRSRVAFWDVDAPATLERLQRDPAAPFRALVPRYDVVFTYGGGDPVVRAYRTLGARTCVPVQRARSRHPPPGTPGPSLRRRPAARCWRRGTGTEIVEGLLGKGARVQVYDPVAMDGARAILGERVTYAPGPYEAVEGADALLLVTEWSEFRNPDLERMRTLTHTPVVLDAPQHLRPGGDAGARLTLPGHRPGAGRRSTGAGRSPHRCSRSGVPNVSLRATRPRGSRQEVHERPDLARPSVPVGCHRR
jgi:hypothetical protein